MNAKIFKKTIITLFLTFITVFSLPLKALAYVDWPANANILSEGAILMDADSGAVLYGKNIHEHYYPASITKILTALIVVENCNLDDIVTFSKNAVYNVEAGSSSAGLDVGDTLTVRDCLYAMLLQSANEAANALADRGICKYDESKSLKSWLYGFTFCQSQRTKQPGSLYKCL